MRVDTREIEDVTILDMDGPLTAGVGDEAVRKAINTVIALGGRKLLLNMSGVTRIDSAGVGELVAGIKRAERDGISVKLVRIGQKVHHILNLSRILPLLDFHEDEDEALREFSQGSE